MTDAIEPRTLTARRNPVMERTLRPELLDSLPVDHPDALHNRRDLRLINQLAGNHRWMLRTLSRRLLPGETALEVGAGTGELGLQLNQARLGTDGLDLWPRPSAWPAERTWHVGDLRAFADYDRYAAVCGNLIFHQFSDVDLALLGAKLRKNVRIIAACEPARRRSSQVLYGLFGPLLGANHVSRHDAHVSIAAGFRGNELARLLGLNDAAWDVRTTSTLLGIYRLIAVRRS
jgi:hypothetical protein